MCLLIKAYCVGGSKCRALPLCAVKLTKPRAILILPRMWLGQYKYCPAALAPCDTSYVQSYVSARTNTLDGSFWLVELTSDSLIASVTDKMTHSPGTAIQ